MVDDLHVELHFFYLIVGAKLSKSFFLASIASKTAKPLEVLLQEWFSPTFNLF